VTDKDGVPIVRGKEVTGFSNEEEGMMDYLQDLPFLLEDRVSHISRLTGRTHYTHILTRHTQLKELGGTYVKAAKPYEVRCFAIITLALLKGNCF